MNNAVPNKYRKSLAICSVVALALAFGCNADDRSTNYSYEETNLEVASSGYQDCPACVDGSCICLFGKGLSGDACQICQGRDRCVLCEGKGELPANVSLPPAIRIRDCIGCYGMGACRVCNGSGHVLIDDRPCPQCLGARYCTLCDGTKRVISVNGKVYGAKGSF